MGGDIQQFFGFGEEDATQAGVDLSREMAGIARMLLGQTDPLRKAVLGQHMNFLGVGPDGTPTGAAPFDVSASPVYQATKAAQGQSFQRAKENVLSSLPSGGALQSALVSLEEQKAAQDAATRGAVAQDELASARSLAFGVPQQSTMGLSAASSALLPAAQIQSGRLNDLVGGAAGMGMNSLLSGGCCFIFIASQGYLHPVARLYRDKKMNNKNRRGYYWLAGRLVPLMQRHKSIAKLVEWLMVKPMMEYGKYYFGHNKWGFVFGGVASFWLRVFNALGNRSPYRRPGTYEVV